MRELLLKLRIRLKIFNIKEKEEKNKQKKNEKKNKKIFSSRLNNNKAKFKQYTTGYQEFCSRGCSDKSTDRVNKIKDTKFRKYGNSGFSNSEKRKRTNFVKILGSKQNLARIFIKI